jgi:hypothetical protein
MLMYELDSPVEHKYGGDLTEEQTARCTRWTELSSPRWMPYAMRLPHVENVCGKFVVQVEGGLHPTYTSCLSNQRVAIDQRLSSVCFRTDSPFGRQQEMFHVDGHITARCTPGLPRSMIFKGAKGIRSVSNLMRDMFLDTEKTIPLVHMGVISSCMGVRLQTSRCCYLENRVTEGFGAAHGGWIAVEARTPDQCNIVRLSVKDWAGLLPEPLTPASNDIVITGKGSVVHRFSWPGLAWDETVEYEILKGCAGVVDRLLSVC